jgi:hypothetical protein
MTLLGLTTMRQIAGVFLRITAMALRNRSISL